MKTLYIYDCMTGRVSLSRSFPVQVGSSPGCPLRVEMSGDAGLFMAAGATGLAFYMQMQDGVTGEYNGQPITIPLSITPDIEQMLVVKDGMFIVYWTGNDATAQEKMSQYRLRRWYLLDAMTNAWQGPYKQEDIATHSNLEKKYTWGLLVGSQKGMCSMRTLQMVIRAHPGMSQPFPVPQSEPVTPTFSPQTPASAVMWQDAQGFFSDTRAYQQQAAPVYQQEPVQQPVVEQPISQQEPLTQTPAPADDDEPEEQDDKVEDEPPDENVGRFTCPVCWLKFDIGDVMSIATHPDLIGDSVLGRDHMQRFLATRFNVLGQALDAKGMPCPDVACPHCRCKLPPGFLESREHIFSIIGAPAAGKSYYLSSLVHEMEHLASKLFGAAWRDADPTGNSMLNDVTYRLFNADTPEEAYLSKTDLDGALYSEFQRHGRSVKLPKPFIYTISSLRDSKKISSLIFYDNAGEHFEPGRNSEDSPGARHVSVADALFFLFDPTTSAPFRRKIGECGDPQLASDAPKRMDQQNVILAETAVRIATILNMTPGERIDKPLAVMLGKCDLWLDKLEDELHSIYTDDGRVDHDIVNKNSDILRSFMMELHPTICTTAETLSSCVRYFAISPLGCSPVKFIDPVTQSVKLGPDPTMLSPKNVCDPTFWALSLLEPYIIPFI